MAAEKRLSIMLALIAGLATTPALAGERTIVHREKSLYRNIIVSDLDGRRCMLFGLADGRQSCIDRVHPERVVLEYPQAMLAALCLHPSPRRALVIGLGGGTIPGALRRLEPDLQIDSVELDPAVVDVSRRYFGFRGDARSRVFVDDGRVFVRKQRRAGKRYDLVFIDAFDVKYIPEHLLTREFMYEIKDVLAPHGIVAANTFRRGALQPYEVATYQSAFGQTMALDAGMGNRVIFAGRDGLPALAQVKARVAASARPFEAIGISADTLVSTLRWQPRETKARALTDQYSPANLLLGY